MTHPDGSRRLQRILAFGVGGPNGSRCGDGVRSGKPVRGWASCLGRGVCGAERCHEGIQSRNIGAQVHRLFSEELFICSSPTSSSRLTPHESLELLDSPESLARSLGLGEWVSVFPSVCE